MAPLLRQQRDAGLVLVLGLLAPFGVPRTFDVRQSRRWRAGGIYLKLTPSTPRRQALWAIVRLMIANIVGKFAQLLQTIGRQRMSEVEQQGRRAVLVYY